MELPIARIAKANMQEKRGGYQFKDSLYNQTLIGLESNGIVSGDIVAVVKVPNLTTPTRPYSFQLFKVTSEYEFITVNSTHLINRVRDRLQEIGYELITIAVAYKGTHGWMVGNRPVDLYVEYGKTYSRAVN